MTVSHYHLIGYVILVAVIAMGKDEQNVGNQLHVHVTIHKTLK